MKNNLYEALERERIEQKRFGFEVPNSVLEDLSLCYTYCVKKTGHEMKISCDTEQILKLVAAWMKRSEKTGLLLCGCCGTGKTSVLNALSLLTSYYNGYFGLRVYSSLKIIELSLYQKELFNKLKTLKYIGIDDFGVEPSTIKDFGTSVSPVSEVFYSRYDNNKVTVISTNLNKQQIKEVYGERIFDRMNEQYETVVFNFKSFR